MTTFITLDFADNGHFNRKGMEKLIKASTRQYVKLCWLKWPPVNLKFHKKLI